MNNSKHKIIISLIVFIIFLPVIGTLLYSLSTGWSGTVLPDGFTIKWYFEVAKSPFLVKALLRTVYICFISLVFIVIIMIPSIFISSYYFPKVEKIMEFLVLICFAIPGAVSVVGLMKIYSRNPFKLTGTLYILLGVYFVLSFPFMYRAIKNDMVSLAMREIIESANILGASTPKASIKLILPNIKKGIRVSVLLSFSILFGEFLLVNMLVGGKYQTMQMFINSIRTGTSGHFSSAVVTVYFLMIFLITFLAFGFNKEEEKGEK